MRDKDKVPKKKTDLPILPPIGIAHSHGTHFIVQRHSSLYMLQLHRALKILFILLLLSGIYGPKFFTMMRFLQIVIRRKGPTIEFLPYLSMQGEQSLQNYIFIMTLSHATQYVLKSVMSWTSKGPDGRLLPNPPICLDLPCW